MKPSIITLLIGLLLLACKPINQPELCSGIIVGTICCLDTVNQRTMQGYYIITEFVAKQPKYTIRKEKYRSFFVQQA